MASKTPSWLEIAQQSLEEKGFYELQDSEVGEHIKLFESEGYPYGTIRALELLTEPIIFDPRIRDILKMFLVDFILGHSLRYTAKPGRYFRFWCGGPNSRLLLVVHQWARGSRVEYWTGSHKVALPVLAPRLDMHQRKVMDPLPESLKEALTKTDCKPQGFNFSKGGLVVADARVAFEIQEGYEFANVFFPRDLLPSLPMLLPNTPGLEEKMKNMKEKSGTIGINFRIDIPTNAMSGSS